MARIGEMITALITILFILQILSAGKLEKVNQCKSFFIKICHIKAIFNYNRHDIINTIL